jgi:hypothetical protein
LWRRAGAVALVAAAAAPPALAQDDAIARRVAAAPDGEVRLAYAARPGVYGNGGTVISWDCRDGERCRRQQVDGDVDGVRDWCACFAGPVRVTLRVRAGAVVSLRARVGGAWRPAADGTRVTDLGTVAAPAAARFFLGLARLDRGRVSKDAILPATLADSITLWPQLLVLARDSSLRTDTRRQAIFWLGQAAESAATAGLDSLATGDDAQLEVREAAVFALSQRPRDEGIPALIRVARTHADPRVRRRALFWLGQSGDARALALFEEILGR